MVISRSFQFVFFYMRHNFLSYYETESKMYYDFENWLFLTKHT